IAFHDLAILERARLGLICVGNDIVRPGLVINERPLHAGRETCAAASAQAGGFDHVGHFARLHPGHSLSESLKATVLFVDINLINVSNIAMADENVRHYLTSAPASRKALTSSMVLSTVISS